MLARLIIIRLKTATEHSHAKSVRLVHGMSNHRQTIATVMLDTRAPRAMARYLARNVQIFQTPTNFGIHGSISGY